MRAFLAIVVVLGCGSDKRPPETKPAPPAPVPDAAPANLGGIEVPVVPAQGLVPFADTAIIVSATPTEIRVEGKTVVELHDGAVDPADTEGGAHGFKIPRLAQVLGQIPLGGSGSGTTIRLDGEKGMVVLALDKSLPATVVFQLVVTAKTQGFKSFGIAALADGKPMMAPLVVPDPPPPVNIEEVKRGAPDANLGPPLPVLPVVSIKKDEVILWSVSGVLGTLREPRLVVKDPATAGPALTKELATFVAQRWSGAVRTDRELELVIMPDSAIPVQTVVAVIGAVRADAAHELFPTIRLSAGLE